MRKLCLILILLLVSWDLEKLGNLIKAAQRKKQLSLLAINCNWDTSHSANVQKVLEFSI